MNTHVLIIAVLVVGVAGCSPQAAGTDPSPAPALAELQNTTYEGIGEKNPVTLVGGSWQGPPFAADGASRPAVQMVRDFRIVGDLDGDAQPEAAVLLAGSSGGTGENLYLAICSRQDGRVVNRGTSLIGDRVQVRSGRIADERIELDVLRAGAEDAMCCPGELVTMSWGMTGTGLVAAEEDRITGRLSLDVLAGSEWVLRWWGMGQSVAAGVEVTLVYREGRFAGSNGCNNYQMGVEAGEGPGEFAVGPGMGTKMFCDGPQGEAESRYMQQMGGANKFGFQAGMLAVTYQVDDEWGTMLFEARDLPEGN